MTSQTELSSHLHYTNMMLEHTYVGVAVYDAQEFRLLDANKVFFDISDRLSEEPGQKKKLVGHPLTESSPKLVAMGIDKVFQAVVETGKSFLQREVPFQSDKVGVTYWNWSLNPVCDESGQITHLVQTIADVTDHVQARQRAEQERARLTLANTLVEAERKRLEVIETVALSVSESLDPLRIGTVAIDAISTHFQALTCCLHVADPAHQMLRLLCERTQVSSGMLLGDLSIIPYEKSSFARKSLTQRTSVVINDMQVDAAQGLIDTQHG